MVTEGDRSAWIAANDTLAKIQAERTALLAPTDAPLETVKALIEAIEERCGELICVCEACAQPVFKGEPWFWGPDTSFCGACAPTFEMLVKEPEGFVDADGDPLGQARCQQWFEDHLAKGGQGTDSMAVPS